MTLRFSTRPIGLRLAVVTCVLAVGCTSSSLRATDSSARPASAGGRQSESPDNDTSAQIERMIVVDFVDGTSQAEIDELEKGFGVDLELNDTVEAPTSGIAWALSKLKPTKPRCSNAFAAIRMSRLPSPWCALPRVSFRTTQCFQSNGT